VSSLSPSLGRPFWTFWSAAALANVGDGIRLAAFPLLAASLTVLNTAHNAGPFVRESITSSRTPPKSRRYDHWAPLAPSASRSAACANARRTASPSASFKHWQRTIPNAHSIPGLANF